MTVDVLVEGRHFRRDWSSGYDVGRRAAAASLADVVAMGARPTALVVALAAPGDLELAWAEALTDGLADEAGTVGASIAGGDVSGAESVTVSVTAIGDLEGRPPLTRAGAAPGDRVVVIGRLGWAAAGLALLERGEAEHPLADAHRRPLVDYDAALAAARAGLLTSLIDVSDGLVADLGHVAEASAVRIELDSAALPVPAELAAAARSFGIDPLEWVTTGGDDHAFAGTVAPPDVVAAVANGALLVGTVTGGPPTVVLSDRPTPAHGGHEHFS